MSQRKAKTPSKRPSGGARAVAAKHRARKAARKRGGDYDEQWSQDLASFVGGPPPKDAAAGFRWLGRAMMFTVHKALTDVGITPEQRREQAGRLTRSAVLALDPAKLSEELRVLYAALKAHDGVTKGAIEVEAPDASDDDRAADGDA